LDSASPQSKKKSGYVNTYLMFSLLYIEWKAVQLCGGSNVLKVSCEPNIVLYPYDIVTQEHKDFNISYLVFMFTKVFQIKQVRGNVHTPTFCNV
jgi:hypothetical protein